MTQKSRLLLGIAGFVLVIAAAAFGYNALQDRVDPAGDAISLAQESGEVSDRPQLQLAPDFTVLDASGNQVKLSDVVANGKPIVLNFWASWCPPCKKEMPEFDAVYQELGDDIQFMMVDLTDGERETMEKAIQHVESEGYTFPVYFDTTQEAGAVYGIRSIPTTLFIDKDGYIVTGAQGAIDDTTLRKGIDLIK